ncbi:rodlin [Streptomyces sp. NPDC049555]|uniref:rodlin n=1 Tax=unclassified Streptomyces TaxID=2593676 RepID=UPI003420FA69
MIKKAMAVVAMAASAVGASGSVALAADGGDQGQHVANANGAGQFYGNTWTSGYMSPQIGLINGSFNKICVGVSDLGVLGLTDIQLLSSNQQQQCTENSVINDGDDPLSHFLDHLISGNGSGNKDVHRDKHH